MGRLNIRKFGDPVLRTKAVLIDEITDDLKTLKEDMIETMLFAEGIGLAANQIGFPISMAVIDRSQLPGEEDKGFLCIINPELKEESGYVEEEEGCLSIPKIKEKVKRPSRIRVEGINLEGKRVTIDADGLYARVLCHEIDHLNGILFVDRLGPVKKHILKNRLKKIANPGN